MLTPLSKFSLGQPVECMWDYNGRTLGIIYAKQWVDAPSGAHFGFWRYWVRKNDGDTYAEIEDSVRAVRLKVKLNIVGRAA